jgi:hypothetical protein
MHAHGLALIPIMSSHICLSLIIPCHRCLHSWLRCRTSAMRLGGQVRTRALILFQLHLTRYSFITCVQAAQCAWAGAGYRPPDSVSSSVFIRKVATRRDNGRFAPSLARSEIVARIEQLEMQEDWIRQQVAASLDPGEHVKQRSMSG